MTASDTIADAPSATPAEPTRRIMAIDALRGFALCGILFINVGGMGEPINWTQPLVAPDLSHPDWQAWWGLTLLVEGAMRALFSMLFGAGFLLFLRAAEGGAGEAGHTRLFVRRALWLCVFGLVNCTLLLWPGDILLIYGLAALVILPFAGRSNRALLLVAGGLLALIALWSAAAAVGGGPPTPEKFARWAGVIAEERAARLGDYADNFAFMWKTTLEWTVTPEFIWWVIEAVPMMLIGMVLLRAGVLIGAASTRLYVRLTLGGFALGLTLGLAEGWIAWTHWTDDQPIAEALVQPRRLALALGWLGGFFLLWRSDAPRLLFAPFAALGRMALTGYLLQSVIGALIFSGFGLGFWGKLNRLELTALVPLIMAGIAVFAMIWLARFRFGPMEWLWRTLTYGRAAPLLRRPAAIAG